MQKQHKDRERGRGGGREIITITLDMDNSGAFLMPVSQSIHTYGTPTSSWIAARVNGNGSAVDKSVQGGERKARQELFRYSDQGKFRSHFSAVREHRGSVSQGFQSGGVIVIKNGCTTAAEPSFHPRQHHHQYVFDPPRGPHLHMTVFMSLSTAVSRIILDDGVFESLYSRITTRLGSSTR